MPTPTQGYLVLADVAGFTAYLAAVELEHAQAILHELFAQLEKRFQPYWATATREGGAVFGQSPARRLPRPETLLELIETSYASFRDQIATMQRHTTCTCQACRAIGDLDLKFFVHYGDYLVYQLAQQQEVLGLSVALLRERVLKKPVSETTAWRGFALFTAPALQQLGLAAANLPLHSQTIHSPVHGEVQTYTLDLQTRYAAQRAARQTVVTPAAADATLTVELAASPPVVWDWLHDPNKRSRWTSGRHWTAGLRLAGRTEVGARNHCAHGIGQALETILDWHPFDYATAEFVASPGNLRLRQTWALAARPPNGTQFTWRLKFYWPLPRGLTRWLAHWPTRLFQQDLARLAQLVQAEAASLPKE